MSQQASLLLAAGPDRPGIVDRISGALFTAGCNLEDSRMSILGGEFALMVLVTGSAGALEAARAALEEISSEMGLLLHLKPARQTLSAPGGLPVRLHAVALDHPGIVHRITNTLHRRGANVTRLDTAISHAPVSGTPVFSLDLEALVPPDCALAQLRAELAALAEEENIDLELRAGE